MYETIASKCCNYTKGICIGALFKVINGKVQHWIDKNKVNKACLVTQGRNCEFFNAYVIPGIPDNSNLRHIMAQYEMRVELPSSNYKLICKKCYRKFSSIIKNRKYCPECSLLVKNQKHAKRQLNYRKRKVIS